jgi:hypothetical protein
LGFPTTWATFQEPPITERLHARFAAVPSTNANRYAVGEVATKLLDPEHPLQFSDSVGAEAAKQVAALNELGKRQTWHLDAAAPQPAETGAESDRGSFVSSASAAEPADTDGHAVGGSGDATVTGKSPFGAKSAQIGFGKAPTRVELTTTTSGFNPAGGAAFAGGGDTDGDGLDSDDPDAPFFGSAESTTAAEQLPGMRGFLAGGGNAAVGVDSDDGSSDEDEFEPYNLPDDSANPNSAKPPAWVTPSLLRS